MVKAVRVEGPYKSLAKLLDADIHACVMKLNSNTVYFGQQKTAIESLPAVLDGVTLLPFRDVAELLGYTVTWNGAEQKATATAIDGSIIDFNARKVHLFEISSLNQEKIYYDKSEDTFLTGVLKCNEVKGIITDNGYTALDDVSQIGAKEIQIGNQSFILPEELDYVREWIGRKVFGYVTADSGETEQSVVALKIEEDDMFFEFDIRDFEGLSGTRLSYTEGDKSKSISISGVPFIIYNGTFERSLREEFFDYECGKVYVGSTDGTEYNIIIIEGYISWYVSYIDDVGMNIYPSDTDRALINGERVLNVDPSKKKRVRL